MTTVKIMVGDVIERLRDLPEKSVHCCVTSPPYWGLRDYGTALWLSGDPDCDHEEIRGGTGKASSKQVTSGGTQGYQYKDVCKKCGAVRVDKQLGLEPTIDEFIEKLTAVFAEVWRVLRDDGTLWLNMGDCYAGGGRGGNPAESSHRMQLGNQGSLIGRAKEPGKIPDGIKAKDLVGQPWRLAFALQAAGWYLRSEIIWWKSNPMPESVTDRPTKSHEQIFLLSKKPRYFYDAEAVKVAASTNTHSRGDNHTPKQDKTPGGKGIRANKTNPMHYQPATRNLRDVWKISSESFSEAHFATFPTELPRKCILAGTSGRGCCPDCGAPLVRIVEKGPPPPEPTDRNPTKRLAPGQAGNVGAGNMGFRASKLSGQEMSKWKAEHPDKTTGWQSGCECGVAPIPCTVLDPFGGAGTTALVASKMGRSAILTELNPEYAAMAARRIEDSCGLLCSVEVDEKARKTTLAIGS